MRDIHNEHPKVKELANLEHDRWLAFYRSEGWKDLTLDERERLEEKGIITETGAHQSPKLKRHCYMCDLDTLIERGAALKKDPLVYDRAAVIETQRILSGEIFCKNSPPH